jgi:hypothetical protein
VPNPASKVDEGFLLLCSLQGTFVIFPLKTECIVDASDPFRPAAPACSRHHSKSGSSIYSVIAAIEFAPTWQNAYYVESGGISEVGET